VLNWENIDTVLRRAYELMEQHGGRTSGPDVQTDLGLSDAEARAAFETLAAGGYITVEQWGGRSIPPVILPAPLGLQRCSGWPPPGGEPTFMIAFLQSVEQRVDDATTPPEERGRLQQLLEAAGRVGRETLVQIASDTIPRQVGL